MNYPLGAKCWQYRALFSTMNFTMNFRGCGGESEIGRLQKLQNMTPFTQEPNGTVPNGTNPKLVRKGLALTLEQLEPFHLEPLSVLFWLR